MFKDIFFHFTSRLIILNKLKPSIESTSMKQTHFRWVIIFLLFVITVINYIDRAAVSFALTPMTKEFALSPNQIGYILGSFGVGYIIATIFGGVLADRFFPKILLTGAVILWSIAIGWMGLATGFITALLARTLLGLAEGPNFPAINRCVSDWLPRHEATRALSASLLAVPFALMIGGPLVTTMIAAFSWRDMFYVLAVISLIWLPFWWVLFRNSPRQSSHVNAIELALIENNIKSAATHAIKKSLLKSLFTNKTLLANYWAFFVFGYFLFFFMGWLPTYLQDRFHLDLKQVGFFDILPWLFGIIFMATGGFLADAVYFKTKNCRYARSHFIWISQLLAGLMIIPIVLVHTLFFALLFISLAVGFILSANGAYYTTTIDVTRSKAATALGLTDGFFALSGILAPVITGWLITLTGSFDTGFLLMSVLALLSVIITLIWHHPERIDNQID